MAVNLACTRNCEIPLNALIIYPVNYCSSLALHFTFTLTGGKVCECIYRSFIKIYMYMMCATCLHTLTV